MNHERKPAPDLARGFMLLLIALAHAHQHLNAVGRDTTPLDQIVVLLRQMLVDGRAFPVFFLLFGYGMVQLTRRRTEQGSGWPAARKLLRRRGWWLLVFGFAHAVTLYDFTIGLYGLAIVLLAGLLRLSDRTLLWVAGLSFIVVTALGSVVTRAEYDLAQSAATAATATEGAIAALRTRILEWVVFTPILLHQVVPAMLIGIWAARSRLLDDPGQHRKRLMQTAVIGLTVSTLGGLPLGLISSLYWADPSDGAKTLCASLHTVTGYAGGLGWAALFGWIASGLAGRRRPIAEAITAIGQRSMTFYIFQSVVFFAVFSVGGVGSRAGQLGADLVAWATWLASLAIAAAMRRRGVGGPAETALRRLVYGKKR